MQAYSQSQGKVIDIPDTINPTGGNMGSLSSAPTQTANGSMDWNKLLGLLALQKKDYGTAASLLGGGTQNASEKTAKQAEDSFQQDVTSGKSLEDLARAYGQYLPPFTIANTYQKTHPKEKVDIEAVNDWATKPTAGTASKKEEAATAATNIYNTSQDVLDTWNSMNQFEKRLPTGLVKAIPALAPNRQKIETTFYTQLLGNLRKLAVGGRLTNQEMSWFHSSVIPGPGDSAASAQAKIDALQSEASKKVNDPNYQLGSDGSVGDDVTSKLKVLGYSDEQIKAYLQVRGIK